jgi:hypothetical protein
VYIRSDVLLLAVAALGEAKLRILRILHVRYEHLHGRHSSHFAVRLMRDAV